MNGSRKSAGRPAPAAMAIIALVVSLAYAVAARIDDGSLERIVVDMLRGGDEPPAGLYSVVRVVDGDTVVISMNGKNETVRLIGLNTPETVDPRRPVECFGKEASAKAKELLENRSVALETDLTQGERDKYMRLLAYVRRDDGLFVNEYMISEGYGYEYTYNVPYAYRDAFRAAEAAAKAGGKGLWAPAVCE